MIRLDMSKNLNRQIDRLGISVNIDDIEECRRAIVYLCEQGIISQSTHNGVMRSIKSKVLDIIIPVYINTYINELERPIKFYDENKHLFSCRLRKFISIVEKFKSKKINKL